MAQKLTGSKEVKSKVHELNNSEFPAKATLPYLSFTFSLIVCSDSLETI
jgi:hypothetical protein